MMLKDNTKKDTGEVIWKVINTGMTIALITVIIILAYQKTYMSIDCSKESHPRCIQCEYEEYVENAPVTPLSFEEFKKKIYLENVTVKQDG